MEQAAGGDHQVDVSAAATPPNANLRYQDAQFMHSTQAGLNGRKGDATSTLVRAVLIERSRAATSERRNHRAVSRGSPPNREPLEGSLCQP